MWPETLRAVTFDCWNTLIVEGQPRASRGVRAEVMRSALAAEGLDLASDQVERALAGARRRHDALWQQGLQWGGREMTQYALERLGADPARDRSGLVLELERVPLRFGARALAGARQTLVALAKRGMRLGLVCDTGFTPGHVIRELLEGQGLLELLEIVVFSDEVGVPKPDRRPFETALRGLGVAPAQSVHVGDLRRTDVAGAREVGMGTVRLRDANDDVAAEHPEADVVVDSHTELSRHLARTSLG